MNKSKQTRFSSCKSNSEPYTESVWRRTFTFALPILKKQTVMLLQFPDTRADGQLGNFNPNKQQTNLFFAFQLPLVSLQASSPAEKAGRQRDTGVLRVGSHTREISVMFELSVKFMVVGASSCASCRSRNFSVPGVR